MKKMFATVIAAAAFALAACASVGPAETPAQKVFAATTAYDAALSVAVAYKRLPPCPQPLPLCSDPSVVSTIQKADIVAFEALKSAQTVVRSLNASPSSLQIAVGWATEAVGAFGRITASLNVK